MVDSYKLRLNIERFNDGKYKAELTLGGRTTTFGYSTRDELFAGLDDLKQELVDYETDKDA